jgi:hypothetical protein
MQAGLNRAEVLTVLSALVLLHHVFYKNSNGLALIKARLFLLRVRDERVTNSLNPIKKRMNKGCTKGSKFYYLKDSVSPLYMKYFT